jgi:Mn-containing catalase
LSQNGKDERGPWNSEPDFKYVANPSWKSVVASGRHQ